MYQTLKEPNPSEGQDTFLLEASAAHKQTARRVHCEMIMKYLTGGIIIGIVIMACLTVSALFLHHSFTHSKHGPHGSVPLPVCRKAATAKLVDSKNMFMWGGKYKKDQLLSDAWRFQMDKATWEKVALKPEGPAGRWKFGEALYGTDLYIFAGDLTGFKYTNDLWRVDTKTGDAVKVRAENLDADNVTEPKIRRACNLAPLDGMDKLVLFGGRTEGKGKGLIFDDLWTYDIPSDEWTLLEKSGQESGPGPRKGASMNVIYPDKVGEWFTKNASPSWGVVMHGGRTDTDYYGDVWVYRQPGGWEQLFDPEKAGSDPFPAPRNHHMNVLVGDLLYVVFGRGGQDDTFFDDLWTFNLSTHQWTQLEYTVAEKKPLWKRYLHSSELSKDGKSIVVFGGEGLDPQGSQDDSKKLNDVLEYSIAEGAWRTVIGSDCKGARKYEEAHSLRATE